MLVSALPCERMRAGASGICKINLVEEVTAVNRWAVAQVIKDRGPDLTILVGAPTHPLLLVADSFLHRAR